MKQELFKLAKTRGFVDSITGCTPYSERALSGILALFAQLNRIAWDRIPLYDVEKLQTTSQASSLIAGPGSYLSEYLLLHRDQKEESIWGGMPADMMYLSNDCSRIVLFENKIGSEVGYDPTPESNQLARQLDYLASLQRDQTKSVSLVLITARSMIDLNWYQSDFQGSLECNERGKLVSGYFVAWEDVFNATIT
ncbi:MAG: hypothetical protein CXR31_14065 [Geobacter sp.]|nr:MAG: hypothetical protein CXR31_14065 [Geobacter sp.]